MGSDDFCACGHVKHVHLASLDVCSIAGCPCRLFIAADEHDGHDEGAAQIATLTADLAVARADLARVEGERDALATKIEETTVAAIAVADVIEGIAPEMLKREARARAWKALAKRLRVDNRARRRETNGFIDWMFEATVRHDRREATLATVEALGWAAIVARDEAIELCEEMIGYVPDYFRERWGHDDDLARLKSSSNSGEKEGGRE